MAQPHVSLGDSYALDHKTQKNFESIAFKNVRLSAVYSKRKATDITSWPNLYSNRDHFNNHYLISYLYPKFDLT
jgi:hypothetical protein